MTLKPKLSSEIDESYIAILSSELKNLGKVVWTKDNDTWILKLEIDNFNYTFGFIYDNFSSVTGNLIISGCVKSIECDFIALATSDFNLNLWICSKARLLEFMESTAPKTIKKEKVDGKWLTYFVYDRQKLLSQVFLSYLEWSSSLRKTLKRPKG